MGYFDGQTAGRLSATERYRCVLYYYIVVQYSAHNRCAHLYSVKIKGPR